jgi:hypothetical protein
LKQLRQTLPRAILIFVIATFQILQELEVQNKSFSKEHFLWLLMQLLVLALMIGRSVAEIFFETDMISNII